MNDILKEVIIIYGSTVVSSIVFNTIYYSKRVEEAYNNSKRKLVYKDLSLSNSADLANLKRICKYEKKGAILASFIPVINVPYTISSIITRKDFYNEFFDKKIEEINKNELILRKRFLEEMKQSENVPFHIQRKFDDEEYLPNEEDYYLVRALNRKKLVKKKEEKKL